MNNCQLRVPLVPAQVIDPLRSRCLCVRVPAPTDGELKQVMDHVAGAEGIALPEQLRAHIAQVPGTFPVPSG